MVVLPRGQWHCSLWSLNTSIFDHIPWPLAYAPMAVQEVTLSQRQLSGRQVKLRTRDVHGPNWPLFWLLSHGHIRWDRAFWHVAQSYYTLVCQSQEEEWGSMQPVPAVPPAITRGCLPWRTLRKRFSRSPCSHREIKATAVGMVKGEPNYIYNIKVSAFVACCSPGPFISRKTQISIFHFHILTRKIACSQLRPIAFGMYATIL